MKVEVNLEFHEDFLLTCETLHVNIVEALMCYVRNVKAYETLHDENTTIEFEATNLFFCNYTKSCLDQGVDFTKENSKLAREAFSTIEFLKENEELELHSIKYVNLIEQVINNMTINYELKKNNLRPTK